MKILADINIPFLRGIAESFGDVVYLPGDGFTKENIRDADTLIVRTVTRFGAENLEGSRVKLICSATIGYDHIDTGYCDRHGISWRNAPGCNSGSVQQYIASALVAMARRKGFSLEGKTIGVVGLGNVGKKVAAMAEILGLRVLKNDPPRQEAEQDGDFVDMETIKKEADIISFHTPLTHDGDHPTYHMADARFFASLARKPLVINSARGGVIDTQAIKRAIRDGAVSGAIVDCWENEPRIDLDYMRMADIATPHIAGYSADGKANATRMSLESVARYWQLPEEAISKILIPQVENRVIDYRITGSVSGAILKTYDPEEDCRRLLAAPASFASLRGNYPLRREYPAYTVCNVDNEADRAILERLGFIVTK